MLTPAVNILNFCGEKRLRNIFWITMLHASSTLLKISCKLLPRKVKIVTLQRTLQFNVPLNFSTNFTFKVLQLLRLYNHISVLYHTIETSDIICTLFYKQHDAESGKKIKQKLSNTLRVNFWYLRFNHFFYQIF